MRRQARALEKQDWLEESAAVALGADPLTSIFERSRADRQGVTYVPEARYALEDAAPPLIASVSSSVQAVVGPEIGMAEFIASANRKLSPSAFKVLLAIYVGGPGRYAANDLARLTFLSKDTVNNAVHECLAKYWLARRSECPQCGTESKFEEGQKLIECAKCRRKTSPQHLYTPQFPVDISATPNGNSVRGSGNLVVDDGNSITPNGDILPLAGFSATPLAETPLPSPNGSSATQFPLSRLKGQLSSNTGKVNPVRGSGTSVTSHAYADSESRIINKDSDSRFPATPGNEETGRIVYASEEWQQMTEKLAKDCARRIGDKSVGFQVKCWSHARKLDWDKGGRRFEDGLLQIAQELAGKHNATGKSQGALWTKMVRRYFEEKGHPLLTDAEVEEWKGIHGSYQPPQL